MPFARDSQLGYITKDPSVLGTGMRVEVTFVDPFEIPPNLNIGHETIGDNQKIWNL